MSITSSGELIQKIRSSLGSSAELLGSGEYEFVAYQTLNELGVDYPIDNRTLQLWGIERGKRHAIDILRIQSAHRFKYKQLSLNHRFNHYDAILKEMDRKFEEALNSDPDLLGVDLLTGSYGTYIENGFVYDQFGNDISKLFYELNYGK